MDYKTTDENPIYTGHDLQGMAVATNYYNWILNTFSKYLKGTVIEVGAGIGTFSEYILKNNPKRLIRIEPSKDMFNSSKRKFEGLDNVESFNNFLNKCTNKIKEKVDTLIYVNVLEHVEHDIAEMKLAKKLLKKDGTVCIYVPALEALMSEADIKVGHYRRYTKKSLKKVLEDAGLEVIELYYSDMIGIIPWYLYYVLHKRQEVDTNSTKLYDTLVIPILRITESIIKPFIGKNLIAIARKK